MRARATGLVDLRFGKQPLRLSEKTKTIERFLFDLHGSIAETLPTECHGLIVIDCITRGFLLLIEFRLGCQPRFLRPEKRRKHLKPKLPRGAQPSDVLCQLEDDNAGTQQDSDVGSNSEVEEDVMLPPENLQQDDTLVQEMEMDRQIWLRCDRCSHKTFVFVLRVPLWCI